MARGNDSRAALVDLRGEYGAASGNAEDLIAAARAAQTPELRAATLLPKDSDATDALLDDGGLDKAEKKIDEGTVLDVAVRGDWVVVVAETEAGRVFKEAFPRKDFGLDGGSKAVGPSSVVEESDEEQAVKDATVERMQAAADAAQAARDAEEAAQKAREKATAKDTGSAKKS